MEHCIRRWYSVYANGCSYMTDCGREWWRVEEDGALPNVVKFCPYCGKPVRPQRVDEDDAPRCDVCEDLTDMLLLSEEDAWQCQQCGRDDIPVEWTDERRRPPTGSAQHPQADRRRQRRIMTCWAI